MTYLGMAAAGLATMALLKQLGIWWTPVYILLGMGVWLATFESGVHATLAGVACGLLAPAVPRRPSRTSGNARPESTVDELKSIIFDTRETRSVADRLINQLHPWTALLIIPIFALGNAGVSVAPSVVGEAATTVIFRAVLVGLVIGKPIGIVGACYLAVKSGLAVLPKGVGWNHIVGVGFLGGIGFTVSILISGLAYEAESVVGHSKIAILFASVLASVAGASILAKAGSGVDFDPEDDSVSDDDLAEDRVADDGTAGLLSTGSAPESADPKSKLKQSTGTRQGANVRS
jgi:NhaA family Na+:H+ antiporter